MKKLKGRSAKKASTTPAWKVAATFVALLFVGSSFLIIEALSQPRYAELTQEEVADALAGARPQSAEDSDLRQLTQMFASGQLEAVSGRALYPRHFRAGAGDPGRGFVLVDPMDFERLTFYLVGPHPGSIVLRVDNSQLEFPASSDVYVLRCDKDALEAAAVILMNANARPLLYISTDLASSCAS